jgi:hydrogenase nickel incorporation protein HypA/HybF
VGARGTATVETVHELSICRSIADIVERHAAGRTVTDVRVQVGHFRQVVPATLEYCWEMTVAGGPLAGSRLDVEHVPARMRCRPCDVVTELTVPVLRCQQCGGVDTELLTGEELLVMSIDVSDVPA